MQEAGARGTGLCVTGGNTRAFYGNDLSHLPALSTRALSHIKHYDPAELVVQCGAGMNLLELIDVLDQKGQMLGFNRQSLVLHQQLGAQLRRLCQGSDGPLRVQPGILYWALVSLMARVITCTLVAR